MKISTKGRYALRMLLDLAQHRDKGFVPLKDIAERQNVSKKYLEQIVPILNKSDMLQTNRDFREVTAWRKSRISTRWGRFCGLRKEIWAPVACLTHEPNQCERNADCITLPIWQGLYRTITEYLDGITLQDIRGSSPAESAAGRSENE